MMSGDRLEVNVTFDERGYIGSAPELRQPGRGRQWRYIRSKSLTVYGRIISLSSCERI